MPNVTNYFQNVTDIKGLLQVTNNVTSGFGWISLSLMVQVIIFLGLLPFGALASALSSAFMMLVAGMFLSYLGLIAWEWLMLWLAQILFIILYVTWQGK